jgi:CheY-specific phosphatase CheX
MTMTVTIEALGRALEHTLSVLGVQVEGAASLAPSKEHDRADVSSRLLVTAEQHLTVIVAANQSTAAKVASAISGDEVLESDALLGDTIGEILNVVVGTAEPKGAREFSIPTIVRAPEHSLELPSTGDVECVVAHTKFGAIRLYRVLRHVV